MPPSSSAAPPCAAEPPSARRSTAETHPLCQYLPAGLKSNTPILKSVTLSETGRRRRELGGGGAATREEEEEEEGSVISVKTG